MNVVIDFTKLQDADDGDTTHYGGEIELMCDDGKMPEKRVYHCRGTDREVHNFFHVIAQDVAKFFGVDPEDLGKMQDLEDEITRYPDKLAITFENGEFQFEGTDVSDTKICDCGRVMGSKSRLHCDEPECEKDAFEQVKCKCGATKDIVSIPVTVKEIVCVVCAEERHGRK